MTVTAERLHAPEQLPQDRTATLALQGARRGGRVPWLDVLRVVAILAVITIHTVSPLTAGATVRTFSSAWWAAATMNTFSLWCVPVFVMISGGLLLRQRRPQSATDFYRRRFHRIGVPLVFWTVVYLLLRNTLFGEQLSGHQLAHDVARGHPFLQMYYLYVIAGLYVVTPPLRLLVARWSAERLRTVAIGVLAFNVADFTLAAVFGAGGVNALTEWVPFLGYFLAGAWLMSSPVGAATARRAGVVALAAAIATITLAALFIDVFGWNAIGRYFLGYQSPTVVVMSCALFLAVRAWAEEREWRPRPGLTHAGAVTFGIFLLHPLLLVPLLQHYGRPSSLVTVLTVVPVIVLSVTLVSGVVTSALMRVPVARRLVS